MDPAFAFLPSHRFSSGNKSVFELWKKQRHKNTCICEKEDSDNFTVRGLFESCHFQV